MYGPPVGEEAGKGNMKHSTTTYILWIVYICLLLVLLPHTAWAFESMEPDGAGGKFTAWTAAIAFEAAIAILTHKLARHMENVKRRVGWARFSYLYLNAFGFGLLSATAISALANLAHAVEFGQPLAIFAQWGIPQGVYSVAFGGILPVVSLTFARVLSNVTDDEDAPNPEVEAAKDTIRDLRRKFAESEQQRKATEAQVKDAEERVKVVEASTEEWVKEHEARTSEKIRSAEDRAKLAEERFGALGDLISRMFGENKKERIIAARNQWPELPGSAIAIIAGTSPSYVSEVLNSAGAIDVTAEYSEVKS